MYNITELVVILLIVLVLFGGSRVASLGKALGEGIGNFKKGLAEAQKEGQEIPTNTVVAPKEDNTQI
jgi:sec-independent protein translocase protein TatA